MYIADIFTASLENWRVKLQEDEWYFAKIKEKITNKLQPQEAYQAISEVVDLTIDQSDGLVCSECFDLLLRLIRIADTTEMPPILISKWKHLVDHASQFGDYHKRQVKEMERWYSRNNPNT
jgi:hypothetical protein